MDSFQEYTILVQIGLISIVALFLKALLRKLNFSPIPIFILLGMLIRFAYESTGINFDATNEVIEIFAEIGLVLILFQVGFESNLGKLLEQISKAVIITTIEVAVSSVCVFLGLFYILGFPIEISLIFAVAFVATSIAITINYWKEIDKLNTRLGSLMLDLSAMDDIFGIVLMTLALSILQALSVSSVHALGVEAIGIIILTLAKVMIFIFLCYLFAEKFELKISNLLKKYEAIPDPVISILCLTLVICGLGAYFGFSLALGAFLVGLGFSRDPGTVRILKTYQSLEEFFTPYFFISIGLAVSGITSISLTAVIVLLLAACLGKLIGVGVPVYLLRLSLYQSLLLGVSMIPRAEITLVILKTAKKIPYIEIEPHIYSAAILTILLTSLIPVSIRPALKRYSE